MSQKEDKTQSLEERWILSLCITATSLAIATAALMMLAQLYLKELNSSPLLISIGSSMIWLGALFGSPLGGILSDHYSTKRSIILILIICALASGGLALMLPVGGVLSCFFLFSFSLATFTPIAMGVASRAGPATKRGKNFSYISSSRSLGWVLGGTMCGFLLQSLGFQYAFAVFAGISLVGVPAFLHVKEIRTRATLNGSSSFRYMRQRRLIGLYIVTILRQIVVTGTLGLIYVYMASRSIQAASMGLLTASNPLTQIFALLVFGRLTDRVRRKHLLLLGIAFSSLSPVFFLIAHNLALMSLGFIAIGIGYGSLYIGSTLHIGDVVPTAGHGRMIGLLESSRGIGGVIGPLLSGVLVSTVGFRIMFMVMAALGGLTLVAAAVGIKNKDLVNSC